VQSRGREYAAGRFSQAEGKKKISPRMNNF